MFINLPRGNFQDIWDKLAERFNTHKVKAFVHPDAAVNIFVGWPIFFELIKKHTADLNKEKLVIMDFGCGVGELCKRLDELGHKVYGVDHSKRMVELARNNVPSEVTIINDNHKSEIFDSDEFKEKIDVITSMHSTEWIEDIEFAFDNWLKILNRTGLIILAVFPKEHVIDSLKIEDLFEDFDSKENPHFGFANFEGIKVPVFIRDERFFDNYFIPKGFVKVSSVLPSYPVTFLKDYNWTGSKFPEMHILAYKRAITT